MNLLKHSFFFMPTRDLTYNMGQC